MWKYRKFNKSVRIIVSAFFAFLIVISMGKNNKSDNNTTDGKWIQSTVGRRNERVIPEEILTESARETKRELIESKPQTTEIMKDSEKNLEIEEETILYHNDSVINRLIIDYNGVAEFPIDQNHIGNGAYNFSANASCNGVWIIIYNSKRLFVDFSIQDFDDTHIYPILRDFFKVMDENLTDEKIADGWKELKTGKYIAYNYYGIGNIECSCWIQKLNNGKISYLVKTGRK